MQIPFELALEAPVQLFEHGQPRLVVGRPASRQLLADGLAQITGLVRILGWHLLVEHGSIQPSPF